MKKYKERLTDEFFAALGTDTDAAVAERFGVSHNVVTMQRYRLGIPPAKRRRAMPRDDMAREYKELGSYAAVARLHGMSRQRVFTILSRMAVGMPPAKKNAAKKNKKNKKKC